jgi:hypothetical protein
MRKHAYVKAHLLKKGDVLVSTDNRRWTIVRIGQVWLTFPQRVEIIAECGSSKQTFNPRVVDRVRVEV